MSTTLWIQLIGGLFGFFMIYFTFLKFKRKELSGGEFLLWFLGWILFIFIAIVPTILDPIINSLNFYRRLDFFVVIGFFMILGLSFHNYVVVKKNQRKMEILVRKMAFREHERKQ